LNERRRHQEIAEAWRNFGGRCSRCGAGTNVYIVESKVWRGSRFALLCEGCLGAPAMGRKPGQVIKL
jgi:hypothetical protein